MALYKVYAVRGIAEEPKFIAEVRAFDSIAAVVQVRERFLMPPHIELKPVEIVPQPPQWKEDDYAPTWDVHAQTTNWLGTSRKYLGSVRATFHDEAMAWARQNYPDYARHHLIVTGRGKAQPAPEPTQPSELGRIAVALERIAASLERDEQLVTIQDEVHYFGERDV